MTGKMSYRRKIIDNDHFIAKISVHCKLDQVLNLIKEKLNVRQIEVFKSSCFGQFLKLKSMTPSWQLVHQLLLRQVEYKNANPNEMWFEVKNQIIRFSPLEFALVTGLEFGTNTNLPTQNLGHRLKDKYFSIEDKIPTLKVYDTIQNCSFEEGDDDIVKLSLVLFLEMCLLSNRKSNINLAHLQLVDSLEMFNSIPWGSIVYQSTVESLNEGVKENRSPTYNLNGFPYSFMIWAFEALSTYPHAKKNSDCIPRMLNWETTPSRKSYEMIAEVFGRKSGHVETELHPTAHEREQSYYRSVTTFRREEMTCNLTPSKRKNQCTEPVNVQRRQRCNPEPAPNHSSQPSQQHQHPRSSGQNHPPQPSQQCQHPRRFNKSKGSASASRSEINRVFDALNNAIPDHVRNVVMEEVHNIFKVEMAKVTNIHKVEMAEVTNKLKVEMAEAANIHKVEMAKLENILVGMAKQVNILEVEIAKQEERLRSHLMEMFGVQGSLIQRKESEAQTKDDEQMGEQLGNEKDCEEDDACERSNKDDLVNREHRTESTHPSVLHPSTLPKRKAVENLKETVVVDEQTDPSWDSDYQGSLIQRNESEAQTKDDEQMGKQLGNEKDREEDDARERANEDDLVNREHRTESTHPSALHPSTLPKRKVVENLKETVVVDEQTDPSRDSDYQGSLIQRKGSEDQTKDDEQMGEQLGNEKDCEEDDARERANEDDLVNHEYRTESTHPSVLHPSTLPKRNVVENLKEMVVVDEQTCPSLDSDNRQIVTTVEKMRIELVVKDFRTELEAQEQSSALNEKTSQALAIVVYSPPHIDVVTNCIQLTSLPSPLHSLPLTPSKPRPTDGDKKLLVLDLNGLLADIGWTPSGLQVNKRPHCDDFLRFCFERFHVGVWSAKKKHNLDKVIPNLMDNSYRKELLFEWDQSKCTNTGWTTTIDQTDEKPIFLKKLRNLWCYLNPEIGDFNETNTLLLDDTPYKALLNPENTAIFPDRYIHKEIDDDVSLGYGGAIRTFLEGLANSNKNVQEYVKDHRIGQEAITESDKDWKFYNDVITSTQK